MKTKNIFDLNDLKYPRASNNTSVSDTFYFRDIYDSFLFQEAKYDFWHRNLFYGRIDQEKYPIICNEQNLVQIQHDGATAFVLKPIARSWNLLLDHVNKSISKGEMKSDSSFVSDLKPVKAWNSLHIQYSEYNNNLYKLFTGNFMSSIRSEKIIDFDSFLKVFLEFFDSIEQTNGAFTKEGFLMSKMADPLSSGMIIEIANFAHDRDLIKASFLKDRNFNSFKEIAQLYGFELDKNAPWRLIADLNSEGMKKSIELSGSSLKTFYDDHFIRVNRWELENLKHVLWGWYTGFTSSIPAVQVYKTTEKKVIIRKQYEEEEMSLIYPELFWIRLYFYLRAKENNVNWYQASFENNVARASDIYRYEGKFKAMDYISKTIKPSHILGVNQIFNQKDLTNKQTYDILDKRIKDSFKSFSYY